MSEHSIIDICVEPIELCKLLKIANMVEGGGEAKTMISEGNVLVNNKVEVQKRKKFVAVILFNVTVKLLRSLLIPPKSQPNLLAP
jgi:ribosome-associated protein